MDAEQQFQTAVRLFQAGDLAEAETALAPLLRALPRHPDVLHLAGVVYLRAGRVDDAIECLKNFAAQRPESVTALDLLGCAYRQGGRLQAAIRTFEKAIGLEPDNPSLHHNLGNVYRDQRDYAKAAEHYGLAVKGNPENLESRIDLGQVLFNLDRLEEAAAAFQAVTSANPSDAEWQVALARTLIRLGDSAGALAALRAAIAAAPADRDANELLAGMLSGGGDLEGALDCLDRLIAAYPGEVRYLWDQADLHHKAGDLEKAVACCRRSLDIVPDDPEALFRLAYLEERGNNPEAARQAVEAGLALAPSHAGLALVAARIDRRDNNFKAGLDRLNAMDLRAMGTSPLVSEIHFELGFLSQNLDRPGEAVDHFTKGNAALVTDARAFHLMKAQTRSYLDRLRTAVQGLPAAPSDRTTAAGPDVPVFLVGFPLSETMLLDQVLGTHPGIQVLEGQETLSEVRNHLLKQDTGFPANLFSFPESDLEDLRAIYFGAVDRSTTRRPGALLVDKTPLNIMDAGLIHRLFPRAKFLLALRHPCDVCLSCFMRPFELNAAMAHFTRLEDTVAFYEEIMGLWQDLRAGLNLNVHEVRYETHVAGLEPAARSLIEFLGLPWNDAVLSPTEYARKQKFIGASGYHQVVETLNTPALDRWRQYEIHLLPHLRRLKPFIDAFGYSA